MKRIAIAQVENGMILTADVCGPAGNVILKSGTTLSEAVGRRLANWGVTKVYVEGVDESLPIKPTTSDTGVKMQAHLKAKFEKCMGNPIMAKLYESVLSYRIANDMGQGIKDG